MHTIIIAGKSDESDEPEKYPDIEIDDVNIFCSKYGDM